MELEERIVPGILESILGHRPRTKLASYHQMHLQKLQAIFGGLVNRLVALS